MSNIGDFMKGVDGSLGVGRGGGPLPGTSVLEPVVNQAFDLWVDFDKTAADGMASTTTADTFIWTNPYDFTLYLQSARMITLGAGLAADNTNNAVITIKTDNGAGGATAIGLTLTTSLTDSGTFLSNQSKTFNTVTGANIALVAGGNLWINIAKGGSGVIVPISSFFIRLRRGEY
jgi:hypothetical protein